MKRLSKLVAIAFFAGGMGTASVRADDLDGGLLDPTLVGDYGSGTRNEIRVDKYRCLFVFKQEVDGMGVDFSKGDLLKWEIWFDGRVKASGVYEVLEAKDIITIDIFLPIRDNLDVRAIGEKGGLTGRGSANTGNIPSTNFGPFGFDVTLRE